MVRDVDLSQNFTLKQDSKEGEAYEGATRGASGGRASLSLNLLGVQGKKEAKLRWWYCMRSFLHVSLSQGNHPLGGEGMS